MKERLSEETIAMRATKEFNDGDYVNLGAGIPTKCSLFIPEEKEVYFHSEQGVAGYFRILTGEERAKADLDYVDASGQFIDSSTLGMSLFDIATSFDLVLGGHLDCTVMGGLEVSESGDLANWSWGTVNVGNIGGSMDLAVGAKRVIIAMTHTTKDGKPKIVRQCKLPLTAKECVDLIITDVAVIEVTKKGLLLKETAPGWTAEDIQAITEPQLIIADALKEISI